MLQIFRVLTSLFVAGVILMAGASAKACQDFLFEPLELHMDHAEAVVLARAVKARVLPVGELGVACDDQGEPSRCEALEVEIEVKEVFKGEVRSKTKIYSPAIPFCVAPVIVGSDHVFFLIDYDGLLGPIAPSFSRAHEEWSSRLSLLQDWKQKRD